MEVMVEKVWNPSQEKPATQSLSTLKTVRVAVYARVSTDQEIQQSSLAEQMKAFKAKIAEHSGWVLVDVYADEGISGTSVKKRKAFLRMMADCEAGKVDYVMTKSISRFARNTVECLSYVRRLQSIGVQVFFEKEGIDTGTAVSEMLLTVLAAFAQEESRSISENLKWGIRKRFAKGVGRWTPTYGFRQDESGNVVIEPDEAEIVRMIFKMYQYGINVPDILDELNFLDAPSARGKKWTKTSLVYLLQNEKYIGDQRLQKWVSVDHISHRSVPNDSTAIPSYYVKNTHTPIIDRHTFRQVQRIMELKSPHGEYSRYPYCDTNFVCPICGKRMTPQVMHTQVKKRAICCFGEDGCQGYSIKTYLVDAALLKAYNALDQKGCKKSAAWKRMQEIKAESPKMESVQYYWLDDLVERVEFFGDTMRVFWKCGLESEVPLNIPKSEEPTHVAELYRSFLGRLQSGDYRPARPNSTRERMLAEAVHGQQNHAVREAKRKGKRPTDLHRASAMRAAQNLKIKRMKGSAVSDR